MESEKVKNLLDRLIEESEELKDPANYNQYFMDWRAKVIRMTSHVFDKGSPQIRSLELTSYVRPTSYPGILSELTKKQIVGTVSRFQKLLHSFVEEHELFQEQKGEVGVSTEVKAKKVFISHSSKDNEIGKEVVTMLQLIGVKHSQIFYTSAAGYGVPLGNDWVETLKSEVSTEGVVLSLLSANYFESQICLLEMGATWVLSRHHIPILIPPLTFKDTNDVINSMQGFQILDRARWSSLKRDLEKLFDLEPLDGDKWEPQRDAILDRITKHLNP